MKSNEGTIIKNFKITHINEKGAVPILPFFPEDATLRITQSGSTVFHFAMHKGQETPPYWQCDDATPEIGRLYGIVPHPTTGTEYRFEICWRAGQSLKEESRICGFISPILPANGSLGEQVGAPGTWEAEEDLGSGGGA